jgi:hypothetical protein
MTLLDRNISPESPQENAPAINWRYQVPDMEVVAPSSVAFAPARAINWRYQTPEISEIDLDAIPASPYVAPKAINWRYQVQNAD